MVIMQIPLVYLFAILPLTGGMMFIRTIQVTYKEIKKLKTHEEEA